MLYLKKRLSQNLILSFFADVFIVSLK